MRKIADYKGSTNTRGPLETEAVKRRTRQLTGSTDRTVTATRASGAEANRLTEKYPGMQGQGQKAENKLVVDRAKRSMREVRRAGARDAANAAAKTAATSAARKAAIGTAARVASRAAGPVGVALGVADAVRSGFKAQAGQNEGTVNTRNSKKTRTNAGPTATGRGGKR